MWKRRVLIEDETATHHEDSEDRKPWLRALRMKVSRRFSSGWRTGREKAQARTGNKYLWHDSIWLGQGHAWLRFKNPLQKLSSYSEGPWVENEVFKRAGWPVRPLRARSVRVPPPGLLSISVYGRIIKFHFAFCLCWKNKARWRLDFHIIHHSHWRMSGSWTQTVGMGSEFKAGE